MATKVLTKAFLSINAVDLSDHIKNIDTPYGVETLDKTAMGDSSRKHLGGLKNWSLAVEFFQDYAAGKVDATIFPIVGNSVAIEYRSDTGAVSATNPKYTGNGIIESYPPVAGGIGEMQMAPITIQGDGDLTRAEA